MKEQAAMKGGRNYGIDLLRVFAVFLIIAIHILGKGGVLSHAKGGAYSISCLLEIAVYCGSNCFAIISGYVYYTEKEKPYRYTKFISLWLMVIFYSFGVTAVYYLMQPEMLDLKVLIKALLPVSTGYHWYFTAYAGLFCLIPWLSKFVRSCSEAEMHRFVLILFVVFSCFATFSGIFGEDFDLDDGYSTLWLAILFLFGAWMKKCAIPERVRPGYAALGLVVCVLGVWLMKIFLHSNLMINYISPVMVLISVCVVMLFARMRVGLRMQKVVSWLAPTAFGVNMLHRQPVLWKHFIVGKFAWMGALPPWLIPAALIACSFVVLAICAPVEKLRLMAYDRMKIDRGIERICGKMMLLIRKKAD